MSAADTPGWLIANQDRNVAQQLNDGVRAFKISTHYGVQTSTSQVYTDIQAEGDRVNRVAEKLDHPRPSRAPALQPLTAPRHRQTASATIWLCHSLCELGATGMAHYLSVIRNFLELNPGNVIVLFDEDYVSELSIRRAFKQAGLFNRLARLQRGQPLPTLGDLIRSRHNIVVFAQEPVSGHFPWNAPGFAWLQDTPLTGGEAEPVHVQAVPRVLDQPAAGDERLGRHLPAAPEPERAAGTEGLHPQARPRVRSPSGARSRT